MTEWERLERYTALGEDRRTITINRSSRAGALCSCHLLYPHSSFARFVENGFDERERKITAADSSDDGFGE